MGADLYIKILHKEAEEKYDRQLDKYIRLRDEAEDEEKREKYQEKVEYYFDKIYNARNGYYRDSYNDSNLLWKMELDYWIWFMGFMNKNGLLTVRNTRKVLKEITSKKRQDLLKKNIAELDKESRDYFLDKNKTFQQFLKRAIEMKQPIVCSV